MPPPKVSVELPEEIIDTHIRAAIADQLGKDPSDLVKAVVDSAMSQKSSSYPYKSLFQEAVDNMIREAAKDIFRSWLNAHSNLIRKAIAERLQREQQGFIDSVADQLVEGLSKSFYVSVSLKVESD